VQIRSRLRALLTLAIAVAGAAAAQESRTGEVLVRIETTLGNIDIAVEQNSLAVRMGNIHVVSTPFTEKETIRVEMTPPQGEVIKFETNSEGKIDALNYAGMRFTRVGR